MQIFLFLPPSPYGKSRNPRRCQQARKQQEKLDTVHDSRRFRCRQSSGRGAQCASFVRFQTPHHNGSKTFHESAAFPHYGRKQTWQQDIGPQHCACIRPPGACIREPLACPVRECVQGQAGPRSFIPLSFFASLPPPVARSAEALACLFFCLEPLFLEIANGSLLALSGIWLPRQIRLLFSSARPRPEAALGNKVNAFVCHSIFFSSPCARSSARIERQIADLEVVGSNPAGRTIWLHRESQFTK